MAQNASWDELTHVLLHIDRLNRHAADLYAIATARSVNGDGTKRDDSVPRGLERTRLVNEVRDQLNSSSRAWGPPTVLQAAIADANRRPPLMPHVVERATALLAGGDGLPANRRGDLVPPPDHLRESLRRFGGGSDEFATGEIRDRQSSRGRIERYWFVDEPFDPCAIVAQYAGSHLVRPKLVRHLVQEWLRSVCHLRAPEALAFRLPRLCEELNDLFFDDPMPTTTRFRSGRAKTISTALVLRHLGRLTEPWGEPQLPLAVLLLLRSARVLRCRYMWSERTVATDRRPSEEYWLPQECITPLCVFEPGFFLARLLGQQSGILGLTYLFRGGILPGPEHGNTWLLTGRPGAGKTVLGLSIAADVAQRGGLGVYVSLEESGASLAHHMAAFGLADRNHLRVAEVEHSKASESLASLDFESGRGALCLYRLSQSSSGAQGIEVNGVVQKIADSTPANINKVVIIDSVEALWFEPDDRFRTGPFGSRLALRDFVTGLQQAGLWTVLLAEKQEDGQLDRTLDKLGFLADAVLELGRFEERRERWLEVHKARHQNFHGGRHVFRLREGRGAVIIPSLAAVRATLRKRQRTTHSQRREIPVSVGGLTAGRGIAEKSSVFFYGRGGVGKSLLTLRTLLEPSVAIGEPSGSAVRPANVLIVTFATPEVRIRQLLHGALESLWSSVRRKRIRWYSPGDNLTGSDIIIELRQLIRESRVSGFPVERIMFDDVESVEHFLPEVAKDKLFWPTLIELVRTEPMTSFFVSNSTQSDKLGQLLSSSTEYAARINADERGQTVAEWEKDLGSWLEDSPSADSDGEPSLED